MSETRPMSEALREALAELETEINRHFHSLISPFGTLKRALEAQGPEAYWTEGDRLPQSFALHPPQAAIGAEPTDTMIRAYLQANDRYWRETDEQPPPPNKWRTGNVEEATRVSLRAALAAPGIGVPVPSPVAWQKPGTNLVVHADLKGDTNNGHEFSLPLVYAGDIRSENSVHQAQAVASSPAEPREPFRGTMNPSGIFTPGEVGVPAEPALTDEQIDETFRTMCQVDPTTDSRVWYVDGATLNKSDIRDFVRAALRGNKP